MPYMTMQRNFTVNTLKGHTIGFVKGEPVWVPPTVIEECMTFGALPVEGEVIPTQEEDGKPAAPQGQVREETIMKAITAMVKANQRNDFGASGRPKVRAIEKAVGFDTDERERDMIWEKYTAAESEKVHGA